MSKICVTCSQVHPSINAAGDPPPEKCPNCEAVLEDYTGSFKTKKTPGEERLTVEFTDDVSFEGRRGVIEALEQGVPVQHTNVRDRKPPDDTVVARRPV